MSTLKKGDYIVNPKTGRTVKVGNRTWLKLVKEGLVDSSFSDPAVLSDTYELSNLDEQKDQINMTLPDNKQAVIGRGVHKGKLVARHKTLGMRDMLKKVSSTVVNHKTDLEDLSDAELELKLESLLLGDMGQPQLERTESRANNLEPLYQLSHADFQETDPAYTDEFSDDEVDLEW
jgi:hypothetical protein